MRRLHPTLEASGYRATAFVRDGRRLVDIRPGYRDRVYGLAVDVGSTTLAVHLCDLLTGEVVASLGRMNPQIRFGEDLMSRVSFAMMNEDGAAEMTDAVREALDELAAEAAAAAGVDPADVLEVAVAGNPVMHHLLLGLDPAPLGFAPFALATDEGTEVAAADIGLRRGGRRGGAGLRAAVHRGPRGGGRGGGGPERDALPEAGGDTHRRRGDERGARARKPGAAARRLVADRARLRRGPVELRAAGSARGHRAGPHRPRHPGAPLPGDRRRALVRRAGVRTRPERDLRLRR